jgi:hypothetical protein
MTLEQVETIETRDLIDSGFPFRASSNPIVIRRLAKSKNQIRIFDVQPRANDCGPQIGMLSSNQMARKLNDKAEFSGPHTSWDKPSMQQL